MHLQVVISNQTNPHLNVAVENYLVAQPTEDVVTLYLWKNRRTVVVGQNQNPFAECDVERLLADGGYVMRRRTGGGAVYHDDGNLNFSFIAPATLYDQGRQFAVLMAAVATYGLSCELSGRNDVLCEGRKFSGNAFSRGRYNNLHHGTILIDTNTDDMRRYLRVKASKLSRHGVTSVQSRVVNLSELAPVTAVNIVGPLIEAFEHEYGAKAVTVPFERIAATEDVKHLYADFASDEWLFAPWRSFSGKRHGHYEWGEVEIDYAINEELHRFITVKISTDSLLVDLPQQAEQILAEADTTYAPSIPADIDEAMCNPLLDIISLLYD